MLLLLVAILCANFLFMAYAVRDLREARRVRAQVERMRRTWIAEVRLSIMAPRMAFALRQCADALRLTSHDEIARVALSEADAVVAAADAAVVDLPASFTTATGGAR